MGKQGRKKEGLSSWGLLILGFVIGVAFVMALLRFGGLDLGGPEPVKKPFVKAVPSGPAPDKTAEPVPVPPEQRPVQPDYPRMAIVIDDMGPDLNKLRELIGIGGPVTVAVMPHQRYSKETADEAYANGLDVLMHLPMEPKDTGVNNPGKGALLVAMTPREVRARMAEDFETVPHAIGINNHMGSRFTENEPLMREVLDVLRTRELFFLDSRTTSMSVAGKLAREMGVRNLDRNVFLDNNRDVAYIKRQLSEAARIARKNGTAVAIGHPYPETIQALRESVPGLDAAGIRVVRLSELVE